MTILTTKSFVSFPDDNTEYLLWKVCFVFNTKRAFTLKKNLLEAFMLFHPFVQVKISEPFIFVSILACINF